MFRDILHSVISEKAGKESDQLKKILAEKLQSSPEQLAQFEQSYFHTALERPYDPARMFDESAKQAKDALHLNEIGHDEELTDQIAEDLLHVWNIHTGYALADSEQNALVTPDMFSQLPEEIRPQLTALAYRKDLGSVPSYHMVLQMLYDSQDLSKDVNARRHAYHMFRQGLDILDLDPVLYEILGMNKNSIGYWFPKLEYANKKHSFFRIPETKIVKVPLPILQMTRIGFETLHQSTRDIVNKWAMKAFDLDVSKTYFVKTGTFSSKFDFRNAKVTGEKEVRELGEYLLFIQSEAVRAAGPLSSPIIYGMSTTNEWCVREFIEDKENNPCIYKGMPLHTEYRVFIDFDTDEILGISPYWRSDVMNRRFQNEADPGNPHDFHDAVIYQMHENTLQKRYDENVDLVLKHITELIPDVDLQGQWSLDIMQNGEDFWLIDMATADTSALRDCVPTKKLNPQQENWWPQLPHPDHTNQDS